MSTEGSEHVPAPVRLIRMATGSWVAQLVYVAAKLRIADHLSAGPRAAADLAAETGAEPDALHRVLRGLVAHDVLVETADRRFALTELGEALRSGVPGSARNFAIMLGEEHYRSWGELLHTVRTGETAFDHVYGTGFFEYLEGHPEAAAPFHGAMTESSLHVGEAVIAAYDFSAFGTIVDVGGGQGRLLAAILTANPRARGILFDRARAIEGARSFIEAEGLTDRCDSVAGDFFESVPTGGDAYVMKAILHDWSDDDCTRILASVRRAALSGTALLIIERVMPERVDDGSVLTQRTVLSDLNMMAVVGGRERTRAEYAALLDRSGFVLQRIVETPAHVHIVEAQAV